MRAKWSKCSILIFLTVTFVSSKPFHRKRLQATDSFAIAMHIPYIRPRHQAWAYRLRWAKEVSVGFTRRLNPWYISIPSNPNLYSTKIIIKMRWQTMFNTLYQPHYHPTTKSLWLCSSVYCRPPHQSRRIWLVAAATNQKVLMQL